MVVREKAETSAPGAEDIRTEKTQKQTCIHHWLIEPAKKPTSTGYCKKCNAVKEFNNYIESRSEFTRLPKPNGGKSK